MTYVKARSPQVSLLTSLTLSVCVQISCKGPDEIEDTAVSAVADAIKGSTLVEVSEDGFQIRRRDVRPPSQSVCVHASTSFLAQILVRFRSPQKFIYLYYLKKHFLDQSIQKCFI